MTYQPPAGVKTSMPLRTAPARSIASVRPRRRRTGVAPDWMKCEQTTL
jgi:hypothetical protein